MRPGVRIGNVAESYYAARTRRDPAWREQQLLEAAEREARRRGRDPEAFKLAGREKSRRCRARHAAHGLTFDELWRRVGGDRRTLVTILGDEECRGRVDYHSTSRRYRLNGGLPADVVVALRALRL
jgi:hypothetical protein